MILRLVVQCIDFYDFSPIERAIDLRVDGHFCPYTMKKGGYFAITRELPPSFTLSVALRGYHELSLEVGEVPPGGIISLQMIRRERAHRNDALLRLGRLPGGTLLVLGYGYFRVQYAKDGSISVKNPAMRCLEGRMFLLRGSSGGAARRVTLGVALDTSMCVYKAASGEMPGEDLVLLPAVELPQAPDGGEVTVALKMPDSGARRIMLETLPPQRLEISQGQTVSNG